MLDPLDPSSLPNWPVPQRHRKVLLDRGLLRLVTHQVVHPSGLSRGDLLELTNAGLRTLAAYLGLSLACAVSHHGLAGGGPRRLSWEPGPGWRSSGQRAGVHVTAGGRELSLIHI